MQTPWTRTWIALGLIWIVATGAGCKDEASKATEAVAETKTAPDNNPGNTQAAATINAAQTDLKAGRVDDAAAKLAGLQVEGATFNTQQAKDYRKAMSEAYDQAIEKAQKGDPKAQAAIQLLRSAAPH